MKQNVTRFTTSLIYFFSSIFLLTCIVTHADARLRPVKTSCPACYQLASEHNATFRRYRDKLREIGKIKKDIEFSDLHEQQDEALLEHAKQEYLKTGTKKAAKIYAGWHKTISERKKLRAERVTKIKKLEGGLLSLAHIMTEDQKRILACEEKNCHGKLRYHGEAVDFFVPSVPHRIQPSCPKCFDAANTYNKIVGEIEQVVDDIKFDKDSYNKRMRMRAGEESSARLEMYSPKYQPVPPIEKDERLNSAKQAYQIDTERLHKKTRELGAAWRAYQHCIDKFCKDKVAQIPDAQYFGEKQRNTIIGVFADAGVASITSGFSGPFGSEKDRGVVDGIGGTARAQHFFQNHPKWDIFADVSIPADDKAIVLDKKTDPASEFNSTLQVDNQLAFTVGAGREVAEFGDCTPSSSNSHNDGCKSVIVNAGLKATKQKLTADIGELGVTKTVDTEYLLSPLVNAELILPLKRNQGATSISALVFQVTLDVLTSHYLHAVTPLGNTFQLRTYPALEVYGSAGIQFAV